MFPFEIFLYFFILFYLFFFFLYFSISRFVLEFQKPRQECWQCHKVRFFFCVAQIKIPLKKILFIFQSKIPARTMYFRKCHKFLSLNSKFRQCARTHFSRCKASWHEDKKKKRVLMYVLKKCN